MFGINQNNESTIERNRRVAKENDIWNAAIEAAAKFVHPDNLDRMRKELKK